MCYISLAKGLHALGPPDPILVPRRPHRHLVQAMPHQMQMQTSSTIHRKHLVLVSQYETERKKSKRLRQDHLRQRGHRLVQLHYIHHLLFHRFGIAEAAWKTFSWTRDLNAEEFYEEAGHPVLTLKPVKLVKIFPQGLWQCAGIKPLLQHHLE